LLNAFVRRWQRRYAVIVNEFGEIGIDGDLIVSTEESCRDEHGCIWLLVRATCPNPASAAGETRRFDARDRATVSEFPAR